MAKKTTSPPINVEDKKSLALNPDDSTSFRVEIEIKNKDLINYLKTFKEDSIPTKVLELVEMGFIAMNSATPTINDSMANEEFEKVKRQIFEQALKFNTELQGFITKYLEQGCGCFDLDLQKQFGDASQIAQLFKKYFDIDTGSISTILHKIIDPDSAFGKAILVGHAESVYSQVQAKIDEIYTTQLAQLNAHFRIDKDGALSKIKSALSTEIGKIRDLSVAFFQKLDTAIKRREDELNALRRSSQKGPIFEDALYMALASLANGYGDFLELSGTSNTISTSKKGDLVWTLGPDSQAPMEVIAMEVKDSAAYKVLQKAVDELEAVKKNRSANVGIFIYEQQQAPINFSGFEQHGMDYIVTVEKDKLPNEEALIFLKTAIYLARLDLIKKANMNKDTFDLAKIESQICTIREAVYQYQDLFVQTNKITKAVSVLNDDFKQEETKILHNLQLILDGCESKLDLNSIPKPTKKTSAKAAKK